MARRRLAPSSGFRVFRLEDRLAPAITADLPTWLAAGPAPIAFGGSQVAEATDGSGTSPANNTVGSVSVVAPDPQDANILFAASPNGGIWRTTNAQAAYPNWLPLTDRLPTQSIASMDVEIGANGSRRLLAGTGAVSDVGRTGDLVGLVYTQDAFAAANGQFGQPLFQLFQGPTTATFSAPFTDATTKVTSQVPVAVNYPNGAFVGVNVTSVVTRSFTPTAGAFSGAATSYLLAATERGVFIAYRLQDGSVTAFRPLNGLGGLPAPTVQATTVGAGTVFSFTGAIDNEGITDLVVDPLDPKRVYASGQFGVFRTNDITNTTPTWIDLSAQLTAGAGRTADDPLIDNDTNRVKVAIHGGRPAAGDPNVVYVAAVNPGPNPADGEVTVLWSTDQATAAGGSKFAGTFTRMDEPVQLSVPISTITDATQAKPIVINAVNNQLENGERVLIEGVGGNGGANGVFRVESAQADSFALTGSAATGKYQAGTGILRQVIGLFPGDTGRAPRHFSLAADPNNPSLVYIGGTRLERSTLTEGFGGGAVLFRGDRSRPFLGGLVSEAILTADTTFQWTPLTDNKAAYLVGTPRTGFLQNSSPASDTRFMAFDPNGNLLEADDGGIFRRQNPSQNGRLDQTDPAEPASASNNKWVSVNGNLQITQFTSIGFDPLGQAAFGNAGDTGASRQPTGGGNQPPNPGATVWTPDASYGPQVQVDILSLPGQTVRYNGIIRSVFDADNNLITQTQLNLGAVADGGRAKGLVAGDKIADTVPSGQLLVAFNNTRPQVAGTSSPGANQVLVGGVALYEDNDQTDAAGQVVGDITPTGYTGRATALVYGGRQPGVNGVFIPTPRVAYVATSTGQLFVRRTVGGFVEVSAALNAVIAATDTTIRSVVTDPDDWRTAYVLRNGVETVSYTTAAGTTATTTVRRDRIFRTLDGGVTFVDITGTLVATGTVDATGTVVGRLDAQGNPVGGLTTELYTLAVYDGDPSTPGFVNGLPTDNDVLLAGGRGGAFRLSALPDGNGGRLPASWTEFGTGLPNVPVNSLSVGEFSYVDGNGQTQRGVGIAAGTIGRGAYIIPDAAARTSDGTQLALASATVRLDGRRGDNTVGPLNALIVADVNNPAFVTVSDGQTFATFERSTIQGFSYVGSAEQIDSVAVLSGGQAGGDLNFVRFPVSIDLGNTKGDAVTVSNGAKTSATVVTIGIESVNPTTPGGLRPVVQRVGFGPADNLFNTAAGGSLRLRGLDQGTFTLDLGTASAAANSVFVQGTKAGVTRIVGGVGVNPVTPTQGDAFVVNSNAGFVQEPVINPNTGKQALDPVTGQPVFRTVAGNLGGTLDFILGDLEIIGPAGAGNRYSLRVSDAGGTSGNNGVVLGRDAAAGLGTVLNLGGPTGTSALRYNAAVGTLNVTGSDSAAVSQSFTVADPLASLTLFTGNGPAGLNIQSLTRPATLSTGASNDVIRVGSRAGVTDDGDLSRITVPLALNAGAGDNRLIVSNAGSAVSTTVTITRSAITGGSAGPITYAATGGRFVDAAGNGGVVYLGSNTAADTITLTSALADSQTLIDGRGGADVILVVADDAANADLRVLGGGGGDTVTVSQGLFGVTARSLRVDGTGTDTFVIQGFDQAFRPDFATLRIDGAGTGTAVVDGSKAETVFTGQARAVFDGLAGQSNLTVVDNTNTVYGSPSNPGAGIVFAPLGQNNGELRFGTLLPVVAFQNLTGSDATGLVVVGDPSGTGQTADTLTVVGPSETGLGGTGTLAGLTDAQADSVISVSDQGVVFESTNAGTGQLRSIALGRVNGRPTISNLVVLAGNQSKAGDRVTVTPSRDTNILVDGQGPARSGTAGNVLTVNTAEAFTLSSTADPALGGQQTRVETADGASFGYRGFGRLVGAAGSGRSIYAVGADVGGGPRVRVYDALTQDVLFDDFVYEQSFTGGVRVATGDVTGDGVPDLITAAGPGGGPRVSVYDGVTFEVVSSFFAYESTFTGGLYLAVGDLDGNGFGEIVTGTGVGGGPLVKAFDARGKLLTSVFAFEQSFRGGVRVAVGDVTGDGKADLVTTAGPGGGPVVRVFDPTSLRPVLEYFAADENLRTGLSVAAGDLNGDGLAEIIVAPASGPVSEAIVRRGEDGSSLGVALFTDQPADATPAPTGVLTDVGGARLAVADANPEGTSRVILAARGPGFPSRVYRYFIDPVLEADSTQAFEDQFVGGVWVG